MNRFLNFLIILFFLYSCSGKDNEKVSVISDGELETLMIEAYKEGMRELEKGDVIYASRKFNEAELLYPQSAWASKSILMAAYAFYSQNYYDRSILELERFISKYPKHKNIDYAHYLLGMCYYENIIDEGRDLDPLLKAKKEFEFLIKNYPNTEFAIDAGFKLGLITDRLAGKEMYIGRHYERSQKWVAAINRFKNVVENYETSAYVEEAIYRLAEVHYIIGLEDEAKKYATLLGYNYGSSNWYKASYKIFNKDYNLSDKEIFSIKETDKKSIFKKFKKRFKNLFN